MKLYFILILLFGFLVINCTSPVPEESSIGEWKGVNPPILTEQEVQEEIAFKMERLDDFMEEANLNGMLFTQVRNFHWITAGQANNQIVLNKDVGAASALIMKDGSKYIICNGSEAPRLMDEIMGELGYTLKQYDWYKANPVTDVRGSILAAIAPGGRIGSDVDFPNTVMVAGQFEPLRYSLLDSEIKRYRWLGKQTAAAVEAVCRALKPGMSEFEIEAMTAAELRSRGIFPTVLLIAVDDRIYNYRHGLAAGVNLKKYAMVNVVAEKWAMPVAVTRFVHFGPLPDELSDKIEKTARVHAHFQKATVPGTSCAEIFEECEKWYAEAGYEGEWQKHHQGGAIGYDDREYVIYPGIDKVVRNRQAFAWNPTITGTKVEDTMIAYTDSFEVVTRTGNWPVIEIKLNGKNYPQPDILVVE